MILFTIIISLFCLSSVLIVVVMVVLYRIFCRVRLYSLSTASKSDAVGGVGISILCPQPQGIDTVGGLLRSSYPLSEVVVALDVARQRNLFLQLKLRYSLIIYMEDGVTIYRSSRCCFRRLVVVVGERIAKQGELLELAARSSMYDYMLSVPSDCRLCASSVGHIVDVIASQRERSVDMVTTSERGIMLLSRRLWRQQGGFYENRGAKRGEGVLHIYEPLICYPTSDRGQSLLVERAEYNFWAFLSLNIMKYRNKLLSLRNRA